MERLWYMRWNRAWNANEYWYAIDDVVIQYMRVIEIFEVHIYAVRRGYGWGAGGGTYTREQQYYNRPEDTNIGRVISLGHRPSHRWHSDEWLAPAVAGSVDSSMYQQTSSSYYFAPHIFCLIFWAIPLFITALGFSHFSIFDFITTSGSIGLLGISSFGFSHTLFVDCTLTHTTKHLACFQRRDRDIKRVLPVKR